MKESLLFNNINVVRKYSITNTSCRLCITLNITQVQIFSANQYFSFSIPMAHNLDISEFWFLSTHPLLFTIIIFFSSITFQFFSHLQKFLYSMALTVHNKWRDDAGDVRRLDVMHPAHYVTCEHVTTPATYKYLQSVRCSTDTQNTKHDLHIATDFVSRPCGSNRILLAGFSVL